VLCSTMKNPAVDARRWAANCLGEFDDARSADVLLRAAYDEHEDFDTREAAFTSLGKVGDARAIPYLEDLMHDPNRVIARDASQCATAIRARIKPKRVDDA